MCARRPLPQALSLGEPRVRRRPPRPTPTRRRACPPRSRRAASCAAWSKALRFSPPRWRRGPVPWPLGSPPSRRQSPRPTSARWPVRPSQPCRATPCAASPPMPRPTEARGRSLRARCRRCRLRRPHRVTLPPLHRVSCDPPPSGRDADPSCFGRWRARTPRGRRASRPRKASVEPFVGMRRPGLRLGPCRPPSQWALLLWLPRPWAPPHPARRTARLRRRRSAAAPTGREPPAPARVTGPTARAHRPAEAASGPAARSHSRRPGSRACPPHHASRATPIPGRPSGSGVCPPSPVGDSRRPPYPPRLPQARRRSWPGPRRGSVPPRAFALAAPPTTLIRMPKPTPHPSGGPPRPARAWPSPRSRCAPRRTDHRRRLARPPADRVRRRSRRVCAPLACRCAPARARLRRHP